MENSRAEDHQEVEDKVCKIEISLVSKLNLANFQNAVPMLRELKIVNGTDADSTSPRVE